MALFGKEKGNPIIASLEAQVASLKDEVIFLRKQNEKLQEALVAKESPLAYQTMKADEAMLGQKESSQPDRLDSKFVTKFMAQREGALFDEVEDLISALGHLGAVPEAKPIGDGNEG